MKKTLSNWLRSAFTRRPSRRRPAARRKAPTARPGFEFLEGRVVPAAVPLASLAVPPDPFIGEAMKLSVTFDNTSATDPGYGPYLDVVLPANGKDGYTGTFPGGTATPPQDGITFKPGSATYLGVPVTTTVLTFDSNGQAVHPYAVDAAGAPRVISGTPGDQLVVFQLPFGSFTPNQPAAAINFEANVSNLADVDAALPITASAGFQFGNDPLNNPATDPTIVQALPTTTTTTPTLVKLKKTYIGPEDETATGPNFPRQYRIDVDIADGQTLTNLALKDLLPGNMQFKQVDGTFIRGTATATTDLGTPATTVPGGTLVRRFATVTGTTAADDATLLFSFYIPLQDNLGQNVLPPDTGAFQLSVDDARAEGDWLPIDTRDRLPLGQPTHVVSDVKTNDHTLEDQSIAVQKSVAVQTDTGAPGASPGDTLRYTLDIQVSDYFAFNNVRVPTDVFSDGQRWDGSFTPTLTLTQEGKTYTVAFSPSNFTVTLRADNDPNTPSTDGSTLVTFNISQQIQDSWTSGMPESWKYGQLVGGLARSLTTNEGPTTGLITFQTVIQDKFSDTYPSGDPSVNENDRLGNTVQIGGDVLDNATLGTTANPNPAPTVTYLDRRDDSAAGVTVAQGALSKFIYAVNGTVGAPAVITPGDTVTYRLRYDLVLGDFEDMALTDYLPLPIFLANDPNVDGVIDTTFTFDSSSPIPAAGSFRFGPANSERSGRVPTVSVDGVSNSVKFAYGTYDDPTNSPDTIDLLFTVRATANPFTDRLFLTNQVRQSDQNTEVVATTRDAIVQVRVTEPQILGVSKGVVASNNSASTFTPGTVGPVTFNAPGTSGARFTGTITSGNLAATPVNSNLANAQGSDLVTFAVVVQNTGSGPKGAFDVVIKDTLPAGFIIPSGGAGLNLRVTDGTGALLPYTSLTGGFFGDGLELTDPSATQGSLPPGVDINGNAINAGKNLVVITYDLQVKTPIAPQDVILNTATLTNYASQEGGPDFAANDPEDDATVTTAPPVVNKVLAGTEISGPGNNAADQAVIGELATYTVTINVPDGTNVTGAKVVDTLDSGLAFVDVVSFTSNAGSLTYTGNPLSPAVGTGGQVITFDLGTVVNTDANNATTQTFTLVYRAVVLNVSGNQAGTKLNNSAAVSWDGGSLTPVSAADLTVVEPQLDTAKSVTVNGSGTTGDAGDPVEYTITIRNTGTVTAYNATFSDPLPAKVTGASITSVTGAAVLADFTLSGGTVQTSSAAGLTLAPGDVITIKVSGTLAGTVSTGESIINTATTKWTSLSGDYTAPRTPNNSNSTERTGAGGVNDYTDDGTATLTVFSPSPAKSIVATSEASTTGSSVAIGEIVRYRLVTRVAEGVSPNFQVYDRLPAGLTFLNDGTAKAALVATTGMTSSTLTPPNAGLFVSGSETNLASITPTFALPDAAVSTSATTNSDTYNTGTNVYFKFGDLTNGDRDGDASSNFEYVVVEFNALVDNSADGSNDAGDTLDNSYRVFVGGSQIGGDSNSVRVTVAEPSLSINKVVTNTTGSVVTYQVTVTAASGANRSTAFDVNVRDVLNGTNLTLVAGSVATVPPGGSITNNSTGNTVDVVIASIAPGASITLQYQANVIGVPAVGTTFDNTAKVTYTSLPGGGTASNPTGSVTPGPQGGNNGERDGSNTPSQNDYFAQDTEKLGALGDTVWYDRNNDGAQQTGEPGIPGAPVTVRWAGRDGVFGNSDDSVITTTTDANGNYKVAGLPVDSPGAFRITVDTTATVFTSNGLTTQTYDASGPLDNQSQVSLTSAVPVNLLQDFGYRGVGRIGDTVFLDVNASGTPDAGEGISGVTVTLTYTLFGQPQTVTTTTDASGVYNFTNLPVGPDGTPINYTVTVGAGLPAGVNNTVDPDGGFNSTSSLGLTTTNNTNLAQDFGYRGPGSIGDTIFLDVNGDNAPTAGEGLAGVTVTLAADVNGDGTPETFTTTTDADGKYLFSGLPVYQANGTTPVNYTVIVNTATLPNGGTGLTNTVDPDGGTANRSSLTLNPADPNNLLQDFGYRGTGSLGDRVWIDADGQGDQDANGLEPGLPGVTMILTYAGQDGVFGNADDVTSTTVTGANGIYTFGNLPAGNYKVDADPTTLPGNLTPTFDFNGVGTPNTSGTVPLAAGQNRTDVDFGYKGTASVGDRVWIDQDGDQVQDGSEPGIPGATVTLTWGGADGDLATAADNVVFTTTTGPNGLYLFESLPVEDLVNGDDYRVAVTLPPAAAGLAPTYDLDGTSTASVADFTVTAGGINQNRRDVDFGYRGVASVAGTVYVDVSDDGAKGSNEPGIPGVTVTLTGTDVFGNPVLNPATGQPYTATTDGQGNYSFGNLPPGSYTVTESQPAAFNDGKDTLGNLGGTKPANDQLGVSLQVNSAGTGYNFGELGKGSIGDTVFLDANGSNTFNPGEGLAGVSVTLSGDINGDGTPETFTTVTTGDGYYQFSNLPVTKLDGSPLEWTVQVAGGLPGGVVNTVDPFGALDGQSKVTLTTGSPSNQLQDFGYRGPGKIGDTVFLDVNNNGQYDPGEGLTGVTVTLTTVIGGQTMTFTRTTDADGQYLFENLPVDLVYTVTVGAGLPPGVSNTVDPDGGNNGTSQVTLTTAVPVNLAQDFGYRGTGALAGTVYLDNDKSGSFLSGVDTGLGGVPVTLTWYGPDGVQGTADDVTSTMPTRTDGSYNFTGLPAGLYAIRETQPAQYADYRETVGTLGGNASWDDNIRFINVGTGQSGVNYNFGELPSPAIGPTDVTSQVTSTLCSFRYVRGTVGNYAAVVRLTNRGPTLVTGTVKVVFKNLAAGVSLRTPTGFTADGDPFLVVNVGQLAAGAFFDVSTVFVVAQGSTAVTFTTQVFAGTF